MYYEEKLIGGVLHWRSTPDGEWKPMSQERLTELVVQLRKQVTLNTPWKRFYDQQQPIPWVPQVGKWLPPSCDPQHPPWGPPFIVTCKEHK